MNNKRRSTSTTALAITVSEDEQYSSHDKDAAVYLVSECITDEETRILFRVLYSGIAMGLLIIIALSSIKFSHKMDSIIHGFPLIYFHISLSCASIIALSITIGYYINRFIYVKQNRKKWTRFRRKLSYIHFADLVLQWINTLFYLLPNAYVAYDRCSK